MKFLKFLALLSFLIFSVAACKKEPKDLWNIEVGNPQPATITDISAELYNPVLSMENFKQKYPWFQGSVSDEDFAVRRKDSTENKIYSDAISKIDQKKLSGDLGNLFAHVKHYFPEFVQPQTFLYSSSLQGVIDPVFIQPQQNMLFIDISGFMGENSPQYKGLDLYLQKSMNPSNIIPKTSAILAEKYVPISDSRQKFIGQIIEYGKLQMLQDAFLPEHPDHLKINYTEAQWQWAKNNEANIWDYFVENDLLFSDDQRLAERFINPAPFSKFYTEIDNQSSPQIGIFSGWMICRKYFEENPETELQDFLKMDATEIFNKTNYKGGR